MPQFPNIPGATALEDWFGYWPSFHDAEILSLSLNRASESRLSLHTWEITRQIDASGNYVLDKHVVVTFTFKRVTDLSLVGFNHQNVIFGLKIEECGQDHEIILDDCFGISGSVKGRGLEILIAPGEPKN